MTRTLLVGLVLTVSLVSGARAQNSVYSVLGIGFPGRATDVRARALGDGVTAFDPRSAVNPAATAAFRRLTVIATVRSAFRKYEAGGVSASGLHDTRFPFALIGGHIGGTPVSFAAGFGTYANRSFDVLSSDTVMLRGVPVPVSDRQRSDGAVSDIRGALGVTLSRAISVGVAGHVLSGSARRTVVRRFGDSAFAPVRQGGVDSYSGFGVSAGVMAVPLPGVRLAAAFRIDDKLERERDSVATGEVELPKTVTGGALLTPTPRLRLSITANWRSWSEADDDVTALGLGRAFDTWELGAGVEFGRANTNFPLRVGFRWAQLPFSPTADQAREITAAVGTAVSLAGGVATIDGTLERVFRDGGGASERVWLLSFGLLISP